MKYVSIAEDRLRGLLKAELLLSYLKILGVENFDEYDIAMKWHNSTCKNLFKDKHLDDFDVTESKLHKMRAILEIQAEDGNWNYDDYMTGLYNGMELMMSIAEERPVVFRDVEGG